MNGGFFVQGQIGWKDRLFISGGVRVDGHSTFGDDFGLEPYPKAQVAYMISDHDFWPEWWETMKLRGAWGESGRSPGPFDALRTWSSVTADDGEPGVTPSNIGEADLGPEKVREYEAGFESSLFDGRLAVQFSYFNQRTFDALVAVQPVPSEGFVNTQLQNVGEFKNTGTETSIDLGILRMDNLNWDLGFSYSTNNSEALNLGLSGCGDTPPPDCRDEIQLSWRQRIVEGFPIPVMVQERVRNPDAAWDDAVFVDDSIIGPTYPTQSFSLNTSVTVARRLTIRALGEWQGGHFLSSGTAYQNVRRRAWPGQPPGASATCNEIQERQRDGNLSGLTAWDRALCDRNSTSYGMWTFPADFFKLRSASVSYRVPASILPNPIRGATLSISGRNLFTITDYPGVDPEAFEDGGAPWALFRQEYYNLPPVRSFIFTLSLDM